MTDGGLADPGSPPRRRGRGRRQQTSGRAAAGGGRRGGAVARPGRADRYLARRLGAEGLTPDSRGSGGPAEGRRGTAPGRPARPTTRFAGTPPGLPPGRRFRRGTVTYPVVWADGRVVRVSVPTDWPASVEF